jgi:hypothetical protein
MDKLLNDNGRIMVSNDGAFLLKNLDIQNPCGILLVEAAIAQVRLVFDYNTRDNITSLRMEIDYDYANIRPSILNFIICCNIIHV